MTGIILAGGKSSRMGVNKAFLNVQGNTIIDNTLSIYKRIFNEVIIVSNTPEEYAYTEVKLVKDIIPGKGPLGGIYTGLLKARHEYCFVAACDMPFVSEDLIRYISSIKGYDAVVPAAEGKYEPLFALYSKNCLEIIKRHLDEGKLKMMDLLSTLKIKEITSEELRKFDNRLLSLINVNTPEDFKNTLNI